MPTVSVIVPLFNKGRFIARALDSVFVQTYQDFEVIVVDDGSTDDGPNIVRQYKDPRLRFIQQENAGPGAARNRGARVSNAKYLAFLDSDDEWLPKFLEVSVKNLEDYPHCALSVSVFYCNDTIQDEMGKCNIPKGPWKLSTHMDPQLMRIAICSIHSAGTVLVSRDVCLRFGGFHENGCTLGEDIYLWLQILLNHWIYRETASLMIYHKEASELTGPNRKIRKVLMPILAYPKQIRRNCPKEYRPLLERFLAHFALVTAHNAVSSNNVLTARYLVGSFPSMRFWHWEYLKLRSKIMFPKLIPLVRRLKRISPRSS